MAQQITLGALSQKENNRQISPSKQMRKLKVELSDRLFELKKLQQDFAEQKAHILMQFSQQKNCLNATIRELKSKMSEDNELWAIKIDEMRRQNQQAVQKNNERWSHKVQTEVAEQVKDIKTKYELEITQLKKTVSKLTEALKQKEKAYEKNLLAVKESHRVYITQIKEQKQTQIEQMKKKLSRDEELKINAIMHIRNSEEKEHANTKNLLLKRQREYNQTNQKMESKIFSLGQQIWALNNKIKVLESQNKEQSQEIIKLEQKRKDIVQMTNQEYEQKIQKSQKQWKQNLYSLNEKWKNEYKKLQQAFEKIANACAEKERLWEDRGNKVLKLYQMREAREQDVKLIEHLQVQLIKKQFELERQKQQLKSCKLQLDNMDDIYKRIFHSVKKNHRHSHSFQLKKMRLPGIVNRSTHPLKQDQD